MSTRNVVVRGLRYLRNGAPSNVLRHEEWTTPFAKASSSVVVKMVAAPIHHHDKWMVQGKHQAQLVRETEGKAPNVAGTEGVGIVQDVGDACTTLKKGDTVVLNTQDVGTWADHLVVEEAKLDRVPGDLQPEDASLLSVYGTAWRMVNDYGKVKPDDVCWVLGGGAVGTATACLLQQKGATVFLVLRGGRPNEWEVHRHLRRHLPSVATVKTTHLNEKLMLKLTSDVAKPKFIFNGMGGQTLKESVRFAADSCKVVSFGNMSQQPLSISVGRHLYQDIQLIPFWYGNYLKGSTRDEREAMYEEIAEMLRTSAHGNHKGSDYQFSPRLFIRAERYAFEEHHRDAIQNSGHLFANRKPVLRFGEEYEWTHSGEWHKEYEYFLPKSLQYVEGMSHALEERHQTEYNSFEAGGPVLQKQFTDVWDSDIAKEARESGKMAPIQMQVDQYNIVSDSYERYLDIQSQKYNIDYSARTSTTDPTSLGPGNEHLHSFFPDDDPHLKKTLKF